MAQPDFIHVATAGVEPCLLLLHGTGGDEHQLQPIAAAIAPGHATLGLRGRVSENGAPRYFRRLSMLEYDVEDIRLRVDEMADWLLADDRLGGGDLVALGYSNGANFAAAMLLLRPEVLIGAILLRCNLPLEPVKRPEVAGRHVLILNGASDPYSRPGDPERLAELLGDGGAEIQLTNQRAGHELTQADVDAAQAWFGAMPAWRGASI